MHHNQQVKVLHKWPGLLGKEFAGKTVMIDQIDNGTWVIKTGRIDS